MCDQPRVAGGFFFWHAQQALCTQAPRPSSNAALWWRRTAGALLLPARCYILLLRVALHLAMRLCGLGCAEPAADADGHDTGVIVHDAPAPPHEPLVCVKLLSTGETRFVRAQDVFALPQRPFLPGERVRRAMLSGDEEDAEVRDAIAS
jgi:hypothetical protein